MPYFSTAYSNGRRNPMAEYVENRERNGWAPIGGDPITPAQNPTNVYPGGDTGVEADYNLRNQWAGYAGGLFNQWAGGRTQEQIDKAKSNFGGAWDALNSAKDAWNAYSPDFSAGEDAWNSYNPDYSSARAAWEKSTLTPEQIANSVASGYEGVYNAGLQLGRNLNSQLAARGSGGNPLAAAALGQAAQFAAGGKRGEIRSDLDKFNAGQYAAKGAGLGQITAAESAYYQAKAAGLSEIAAQKAAAQAAKASGMSQYATGYADIASQLAALDASPLAISQQDQQAMLDRLWTEYDRYKNAVPHPDSWTPDANDGGYAGGGGGRNPLGGALGPVHPTWMTV